MSEAMTLPDQPPPVSEHSLPEPRGAEWTWADLDALPDGGPKTEIVEGALLVSPKPAHNHQFAAIELTILLREVYELDGRAYRLAHTLRAGTSSRLEQPFPVEVDPAILVRAPTNLAV